MIPCTDRLAVHVGNFGADASLDWTRGAQGHLADLVNKEVEIELDKLGEEIVEAAERFKEEFPGELPSVLYVQLSRSSGWSVRFSTSEDSETEMTRWDTGAEVPMLFDAVQSDDLDAVVNYAGDIKAGWEDEWTED